MNAVLISIWPQPCYWIATGKKDIEVRKTRPKVDTPFKCYIYCTKNKDESDLLELYSQSDGKIKKMNSRVIGEFVCDMIFSIPVGYSDPKSDITLNVFLNTHLSNTCLSEKEITDYIGNRKTGYGWHISDLEIYDEPKELNKFSKYGYYSVGGCCGNFKCENYINNGYYEPPTCSIEGCSVIHAPQSWCYVEERSENDVH